MDTEKQRAFIIHVVYIVLVFALILFFFRDVIYYIFPFFIGFLIAFLLRPLIKKISARLQHEKFFAVLIVLLFYLTIGTLFVILCMKGYRILLEFFKDMPAIYESTLVPFADGIIEFLKEHGIMLSDVEKILNSISDTFSKIVSKGSSWAVDAIANVATNIPGIVVSFFFAVMSSFFMAADYSAITTFFYRQLNPHQQEIVVHVRSFIMTTIGNYIISYGKLMSLTFIELMIGFIILGIDNPIGMAFVISVFDVLPLLGTGGIMIPWVIIEIVQQNIQLAIGLAILYGIVTVIRNIVEPKIVGKQVGLHPLLMLLCMYIGARLFGFLGIFIMPFLILTIKSLNESGLIHLYK